MPEMTLEVLRMYLNVLQPDAQKLYEAAYQVLSCYRDTLSEEFQISAQIVDVFWNRAKQYYGVES